MNDQATATATLRLGHSRWHLLRGIALGNLMFLVGQSKKIPSATRLGRYQSPNSNVAVFIPVPTSSSTTLRLRFWKTRWVRSMVLQAFSPAYLTLAYRHLFLPHQTTLQAFQMRDDRM